MTPPRKYVIRCNGGDKTRGPTVRHFGRIIGRAAALERADELDEVHPECAPHVALGIDR